MRTLSAILVMLIAMPVMALADDARKEAITKAPAPVDLPQIEKAIQRGVDFLVADQNANGSWGNPTQTKGLNIYAPVPDAHLAFRAGATCLAVSGMMDVGDKRPEVQAAIDRCQTWALEALPRMRRPDPMCVYNSWGYAYGLRALDRFYQRAPKSSELQARIKETAQEQVSLANRMSELNGGWGYLDLDNLTTNKPSGISTSFTTATMLLAMHEAREDLGVKLDDKVVRDAVRSIVMQRTPDFSYGYSFDHRMRPRYEINRPAGSLARSQACNAALKAFGDEKITDDVFRTWAKRFLDREGWLSNGRKRPVPHETFFKISGYFYYYGIYYFTESAKHLPLAEQKELAKHLAAVILEKQEADGSWWDYPLYSYHKPYGTGYALMALAWCQNVLKA